MQTIEGMMPGQALNVFLEALKKATRKVPQNYFQLPVAGQKLPIYRERVYCYELYHQLRVALPHDFHFSLAGEVDKSGHPIIRTPPLNRWKPDFLVHSAGNMKGNLLAVEVKSGLAKSRGIKKDIEMLISCLNHSNYEYGMLLIYGGRSSQWLGKLKQFVGSHTNCPDFRRRVLVYWHEKADSSASEVTWEEILNA